MARISEAALATLEIVAENQVLAFQRMIPPDGLTSEEREEFVRIVNTVPAENLLPQNRQLLIQYVRHVGIANLVDAAIKQAMIDGRPQDVAELSKAQVRESKIIQGLMTSLRITPQSIAISVTQGAKKQVTIASPWSNVKPTGAGGT